MQKFPIVTISLINYNGKKFVFKAIESAINQNYPNLEIILIDNNSTDGTREDIEKMIPEWEERRREIAQCCFYSSFRAVEPKCELQEDSTGLRHNGASVDKNPPTPFDKVGSIRYIKNTENAGFGKPHNAAMRIMKGDFILFLNSDAIIASNYIENALRPFKDPKVGAVQGKLLRYDFDVDKLLKDKDDPELNIIDTVGLMILKNRRIICVGQGQPDKGQFEKEKEIFGADGAVSIYRKRSLEDIKLPIIGNKKDYEYEYFDENFFLYKEDVDLAWRLQLYGWKTIYTPKAIAYHSRGSGDSMAKSYLNIIKERRKINNFAKYLSFKQQRLMQIKNDFTSLLFIKHLPNFIIKEICAWAYMIVFERFLFRTLKDLYYDVPLFVKKRKIVMARKRISANEMEKWFF